MGLTVSGEQVLAWQLGRQFLEPRGPRGAVEVVRRLCGVQAQVWSAAELAVALRQEEPDPDAVDRAVADGALMKTWAVRGTLHLLPPAGAGPYLAAVGSIGNWLKPSWQKESGVSPADIDALTDEVREVLGEGEPLTRDELVTRLVADPRFAGMEERLRSGWGSVLKPLAWRGVLCHGPNRGTRITFVAPERAFPDWGGVPDPDEAAPGVVAAYLGVHGPGTPEVFDRWLSQGFSSRPRVRRWFEALGERLTEVDVDGRAAFVLTEHADELAGTAPFRGVRLLGGFDQYVLGPTTRDELVLPAAHRALVSRAAGWISPVVVVDGRVTGVWEASGEDLVVTPFPGAARPPAKALEREAARVAAATGATRLRVQVRAA